MPRIFDNIEQHLLPALQETLKTSERADFCVGYFNLRGWRQLDSYVENLKGGDDHCCRVLIGMQKLPQDELRDALSLSQKPDGVDQQTIIRLKKKLAEDLREQLTLGAPTNEDETGLRRLSTQLKAKKVVVKLFLRHPLHAKLYLLFRDDFNNPVSGYLGSSNLTLSGLSKQGELNVDVLDHDACQKLVKWFQYRWEDQWCVDISKELAEIIDASWARETEIPPYHIYLKMAYHLSKEAREGLIEFQIPKEFGNKLFDFQTAAVKIAAHHINKRGGVLIGDVVGFGKTLMASAVARIIEDDQYLETLILCPKNLVPMWEDYRMRYRLRATVLSITQAAKKLPHLPRHRLVVIDESHNLRNREGKRYKAIQEYIQKNESKTILLSATPYNKVFLDLSNQLRLFVPPDKDLGIRPEKKLREMGETEFLRKFQVPVRTLAAFEKSEHVDDWRELMRLYLIRRTRTFIKENYAHTDADTGRKYLTFEDGSRSYFPDRVPKTIKFDLNEKNSEDAYAKLYSDTVVRAINALNLPRYGLGNYLKDQPQEKLTPIEIQYIDDLSRAGKRLMGFCRTNIFKRLESCGAAFLQSLERHILRNFVFIHALENGLEIPLGAQGAEYFDEGISDEDVEIGTADLFDNDEADENEEQPSTSDVKSPLKNENDFRARSQAIYANYVNRHKRRFKWLRSSLFQDDLKKDLLKDAQKLLDVLKEFGDWSPANDNKLKELKNLLTRIHPKEKVLIFTQFADTVQYLSSELKAAGVHDMEGVTGDSSDPTRLAWRFSPVSNEKRGVIDSENELKVLVATDVLSEGQNLQDCAIVINYDLPWAIIRLVQRVGRVDRIGQKSSHIRCYSFLPADGVERIIRLRARVRQRLKENAEVVGTDEAFFEDDPNNQLLKDLFTEKSGIYDSDPDSEVDLASYAYQIWKNAIDRDASLEKDIPALPAVAYSTRQFVGSEKAPNGVLVYMRTAEGNDALAWVDQNGQSVTQSQLTILRTAECKPETPALPRHHTHHTLVKKGVEHMIEEEQSTGGQLGRPSGARFRIYERLKRYRDDLLKNAPLLRTASLDKAIDEIYKYPLRPAAVDTLNRQFKSGASDEALAEIVTTLREDNRLSNIQEGEQKSEPQIICSMGLFEEKQGT